MLQKSNKSKIFSNVSIDIIICIYSQKIKFKKYLADR